MRCTWSRASVSVAMMALHFLAFVHATVEQHTLSDGQLVHRERTPVRHAHGDASVCDDSVTAEASPCDVLGLTRAARISVRTPTLLLGGIVEAVSLAPTLQLPNARAPLSWAPKASPPALS